MLPKSAESTVRCRSASTPAAGGPNVSNISSSHPRIGRSASRSGGRPSSSSGSRPSTGDSIRSVGRAIVAASSLNGASECIAPLRVDNLNRADDSLRDQFSAMLHHMNGSGLLQLEQLWREENVAEAQHGRVGLSDVQTIAWHGIYAQPDWDIPICVAKTEVEARPGYRTMDACEYLDTKATLKKKVQLLATMMRQSTGTVIYSGAGLSTASGIGDYASKAKGSVAPHKQKHKSTPNRLELQPTFSHHALAAMEENGFLHHWLQQNHDRLPQKAGVPPQKINEIHGAWGDDKNPVKMMDDRLRADLLEWMGEWSKKADMCIAMGTSLCGMNADQVAEACAQRFNAGHGHGLVIINLQRTAMDSRSSLRIWGVLDDVLGLLAAELRVAVPLKKCVSRGQQWQSKHPRCKYNTPKRSTRDPL